MSKTFTAPFAQTPKTGIAVCTTAVDDIGIVNPANTVLLFTAGADGALVTRAWAMPRATVTATGLYLFIRKSGDTSTDRYLIDSELMSAHTVAGTTAIPETAFSNISEGNPLRLEAGDVLYAGVAVTLAGGIVFRLEATDF